MLERDRKIKDLEKVIIGKDRKIKDLEKDIIKRVTKNHETQTDDLNYGGEEDGNEKEESKGESEKIEDDTDNNVGDGDEEEESEGEMENIKDDNDKNYKNDINDKNVIAATRKCEICNSVITGPPYSGRRGWDLCRPCFYDINLQKTRKNIF